MTDERIIAFLQAHLQDMNEITPPESVHALGPDALRSPDITFWSAWEGDELVGCGALKELDPRSGEIKSMRTVAAHRGRGVASKLLEHIIQEAKRRSYTHLHLETGAMAEFGPARKLYLRHGFEYGRPFADYAEDRNSCFMTRRLIYGTQPRP